MLFSRPPFPQKVEGRRRDHERERPKLERPKQQEPSKQRKKKKMVAVIQNQMVLTS
jgi:hypothetical protein